MRRKYPTIPADGLRCYAALLICATIASTGFAQAVSPIESTQADLPRGPQARSTPRARANPLPRGVDPSTVWSIPLQNAAPRGGNTCEFDNGMPLDDFGDPSSHLSEPPAEPAWQFLAGAADDFTFIEPMPAEPNCRITTIRAAFHIDDQLGLASPTNTWDSVLVTVYPDSVMNLPAGAPTNMGGVLGSYIRTLEIPVSSLQNETLVGVCRPSYVIDIPVSIVVQKNTRYWLSIIPRYAAPPQSFWCLSESNTDLDAVFGFPLDPMFPFWSAFGGNLSACPDAPLPGVNVNLSFSLTAVSEADKTGACCDDAVPGCTDGVSVVVCQQLTQRFAHSLSCADMPFSPPCGTTAPGACCMGDAGCFDMQTPAQCESLGGTYVPGDCMSVSCPGACCLGSAGCMDSQTPEECDLLGGIFLAGDCMSVTCPGACCLANSSCMDMQSLEECGLLGGTFFEGDCLSVTCPGACCMGDAGCIDMQTPAQCEGLGGTYVPGDCMSVSCLGACCHVDGSCEDLSENDCVAVGDVFGGPDTLCGIFVCPPPGGACTVDAPMEVSGSDSAVDELFGDSVAISGDVAVVGASNHVSIGAAYVFLRSMGTWSEDAKLTPVDGAMGDGFGEAAALDGDSAIIGSPRGPGAVADSGAAYVFVNSMGGWMPEQKIFDSMGTNVQLFGHAVSIDGDSALIGAPGDTAGVAAGAGAGFVFTRTAGVWSPQQKLIAMDAELNDQLGWSADISGDTAILGAIGEDDGGNGAGTAYVFTRSAGVWTQEMKLVASDATMGIAFGWSVAVDGDTAVVGAPMSTGGGSAYFFVRSGGMWTQQQKLTADDGAAGDQFGMSVDVDGETVIVGAPGDDDGGSSAGSAYVFVRTAGVWTQRQKLVANDPSGDAEFGEVGIRGNSIVVGAKGGGVMTPGSGSAYFFNLSCEGACCLGDGMCLLLTPEDCAMMSGTHLGNGSLCGPDSCLFLTRGCAGDLNNDCAVTELDLPIFVDALLGMVVLSPAAECRADVNADGDLNGLDIQPFIDALLAMSVCNCCRGDTNQDGVLDGLDLQGLVDAILMPLDPCSLDYANADVNADDFVDLADVDAMVAKLIAGETCPVGP
ncbi:MAG: hypothetical protein HS101_08160 [Planctomycetia bacterium]|nr:hypothetical protein [Planctomycetia bacterium]MCC7316505.1 hypothetical protein [Planctomycetota bacterium]